MLQILAYGNKKKFRDVIELRDYSIKEVLSDFPECEEYYKGYIEGMRFVLKCLGETEGTELRRFHKQLDKDLYNRGEKNDL